MRGRSFAALGLAIFVGLPAAFVSACSSDPSDGDPGASSGIPALDASSADTGPVNPKDSGGGGTDSSVPDTGPPDTTAPLGVTDLAATAAGHTSIALAWTAPEDPVGKNVASYEIRYSKTAITNLTDFNAATAINVPTPKPVGSAETFTVNALEPETTYYFAMRARDAAANAGPLSNVATATTKARATVLLTEVAMLNPAGADGSPGFDFIELVVTKAGTMKDIEVKQSGSPVSLHKFADFEVALNDRVVVHLTGLPGPTNFQQEDAMKSKTASTETAAFGSVDAFDVYSAGTGLVATDNLVSVVDGTTVVDAVAYSGRDADASAASMTAFATAKTANSWSFTAAPVDGTNDCATQREAVAVSSTLGAGTCGRFPTGIAANISINRIGTTDTNSKKDWYVAAATPGAANSAIPAPTILNATPTSLTSVDIRFSQEIDAATVALNVFTGSGVTVNAAVLGDANYVTLTTTTQNGPHSIGIDAALKTIYGASVPNIARFCGYEPLGGLVEMVEVGPKISGADLVELQATRAGVIGNLSVRRDPQSMADAGTLVANFPSGFCVALNDLVIIHLQPAAAPAMPNETTAKNEVLQMTEASYYDGAWDIRGGSSGLPQEDAVLAIRDTAANAYVDAMVYSDPDGTSNADFLTSLAFVQGLGLWLPANCAGAACTDVSTPTAQAIAAPITGVGTTATGNSLRRAVGATRTGASWPVGAQSWGAINP